MCGNRRIAGLSSPLRAGAPLPVGVNLFVTQSQQPDIPLWHVDQGICAFLLADLALTVVVFSFPDIALWLPKLLYR